MIKVYAASNNNNPGQDWQNFVNSGGYGAGGNVYEG